MVHKKFSFFYTLNVNDLVDEAGVFMSPAELINKFNLTFLQAYGIMCAIPSSWKSKIREFGKRLPVVKSQNIERLFKTKKGDQFCLRYFAKVGCHTANQGAV